MKRFHAVVASLGVLLVVAHARAQAAPPLAEHAPPPRPALWGGLVALGAGYGVGAGLAWKHRDQSEVGWLWLPVVGPFLALGLRSEADNGCGAGTSVAPATAPSDEGCKDTSLDWALVFDGAMQTLGAGLVVASFAFEGSSQVGVGFNRNGPVAVGQF